MQISEDITRKSRVTYINNFPIESLKDQQFTKIQKLCFLLQNMIKDFSFEALNRTSSDRKGDQSQKTQFSKTCEVFIRKRKQSQTPDIVDPVIGHSKLIDMVYYVKRPASSVESINVPNFIRTLHSSDPVYNLAFKQVRKLFSDLEFTDANIWICRDSVSKDIVVYFSQSRIIPQSKCCDAHIKIVLSETGHIDCNKCNTRLMEFVFLTSEKLKSPNHLFSSIKRKNHSINQAVSRRIASGKYRCGYLRSLVPNNKKSSPKSYDCMVLKKCDSRCSGYYRPSKSKNSSPVLKQFAQIKQAISSLYDNL